MLIYILIEISFILFYHVNIHINRNILIAINLHSDRTESQQQKQDLSFLDDIMALKM